FELPEGAMSLPYNGALPHDVGLLFAFLVGSPLNPLVAAAGAMIFSITYSTVKDALSDSVSFSHTSPQPHQVEPQTAPFTTKRQPVTCAQCGTQLNVETRSFGPVLHCPRCVAVRKAQAPVLLPGE